MTTQYRLTSRSRAKSIAEIMTPRKKTVGAASRHEKLVSFVISNNGTLVAAYNYVNSAEFKIAYITDGATDSWATIIKVEVGPRLFMQHTIYRYYLYRHYSLLGHALFPLISHFE